MGSTIEKGVARVKLRGPGLKGAHEIMFKKPFVGRSFVSSLRTSLLVRFV